jgi:hypothetical protein
MVLDEVFLISKRILKFINLQLKSIKYMQTIIFGNLDVIIIGDFYQIQPIHDARVFETNMNNIDSLTPIFWMGKIKCNELNQVTNNSSIY